MKNEDDYHSGIEWPEVNGKVSTSVTNKSVWMEALEKGLLLEDDCSSEAKERAGILLTKMKEQARKDWRFGYIDLVHEFTVIMSMCDTNDALKMAKAGLNALNSAMILHTPKNKNTVVSAKDAVLIDGTVPLIPLSTYAVVSSSSIKAVVDEDKKKYGMVCPRGGTSLLRGEKMTSQLQMWVEYGCIEASACQRASAIANLSSISDELNVKDKIFVLLGATSALGPAQVLLDIGCTMMAIARPGKKLQSLIHHVQHQSPPGTELLVPQQQQQQQQQQPGADLIQHAPELARWIVQTASLSQYQTKQLVICNLAYLDGEKNVRASVAMDLITEYVCQQKPNTAISYILSPSTSHVVSEEAAMDAKKRYQSRAWWHKSFHLLSMSKHLKPSNVWLDDENHNNNNNGNRVLNGMVSQQGPNYALTKSSQQWRAMVLAYDDNNHVVSANFGPPCRTDNMISHSNIAAAIEGMQYIPPHVTFDPTVARTLLTALLLYDICLQPRTNHPQQHPMRYFLDGAAHGGAWRSPYLGDSIGAFSFLMGKVGGSWTPEGSLSSPSSNHTHNDTITTV